MSDGQRLPRSRALLARALLAALLTVACVPASRGQPAAAPASPVAVTVGAVSPTLVTPTESLGAEDLAARAAAELRAGDWDAALADYDRLALVERDGPAALQAQLGAATALDARGDPSAAATRYEDIVRRFPESPAARLARVRLVRLRAYLEQWDLAGATATALLETYPDLGPAERLVAHGGRALMLVAAGALDDATLEIERGRDLIEAQGLDRAGRLSRDLAAVYFALGEVRRARAEEIRFAPRPVDFGAALERRCQLLLDAQGAYSDVMRAYDAHWSAMAGYRTAELYHSLYRDLMAVPPPAGADTTQRRDLFEGAMRLRYAILLEKARGMLDHTLAMAERVGEDSDWVARAREARAELDQALRREQEAIARLPYTRDELDRALRSMARP